MADQMHLKQMCCLSSTPVLATNSGQREPLPSPIALAKIKGTGRQNKMILYAPQILPRSLQEKQKSFLREAATVV